MRTTVNIRDEALARVKEDAQARGISLGEAVSEAILAAFQDRAEPSTRTRIHLPTSGSGGLRPGVSLDRGADLRDLMDGLA